MSLIEYFSQTHNSDELKELLDVMGVRGKPTRKDERAELLVRTLTSRRELQDLLDRMRDIERKALAAAFHNDGIFDPHAFLAQYRALPDRPSGGRWSYSTKLYTLDLFFRGMTRWRSWQHYAIHPELMPLLEPLMPPPDRFVLNGPVETPTAMDVEGDIFPAIAVETEKRGPHDLLLFLALLNQGEVKYSSSMKQLTKKSQEVLEAKLAASDGDATDSEFLNYVNATGLALFAYTAGLVDRNGNLSEEGKAYLATESPEILFDAFLEWSEEGWFDEITLIDGIRGAGSKGVRLTHPSARRERIIEARSWAPTTGVWIDTYDLYRAIQIWHMDFDVEEGGIDHLHVGSYSRRGRYAEPWADYTNAWYFIKGLYINAVVWAFLASIGAVDILYVHDAADYFRPSPTPVRKSGPSATSTAWPLSASRRWAPISLGRRAATSRRNLPKRRSSPPAPRASSPCCPV
ncbi:MAG: hypothetical protein R2873_35960 [Caldilineaceae bacterium]